jgi:hypothetical protein
LFQKKSFDEIRKNDSSLLSEILKEEFTKSGSMKFFEEDEKMLKNNFLKTLGDWKKLSEEDKKKFPHGLKNLFDEFLIKKLEDFIDVKSLHQVQPKVYEQPIVDQEEEMKFVDFKSKMSYHYFLEAKEKETEKQKHTFTIITGGIGSGKTRTCHEIARRLKHCFTHVDDCFKNTIMIYIDFSKSQILPEEKDVFQILGLRLFVKALTESGSIEELKKKGFDLKYFLDENAFEIGKVMKLIASTYHKLLNSDAPIPVVIACDEFQFMIKEFPKNYKQIYRILGGCMRNTNYYSRKIFCQNNLIIYPIITGEVTKEEVLFEITDFDNNSIYLSPLTWNGIEKVLKSSGIHQSFFDTNEKIRFWCLVGTIPRVLHDSINIIKMSNLVTLTPTLIHSLFREIERVLNISYLEKETDVECPEFLFYLVSGCNVNQYSKWFREKSRQGLIYIQNTYHERIYVQKSRLLLPFPYFENLVKGYLNISPDLIPLTSFFTWKQFESLTLRVIFSNLHGRKTFDLETLGFSNRQFSIQELFPGAHFNPTIKYTQLDLAHDVDFQVKKFPFLTGTIENPEFNNFEFVNNKTMVIQEPNSSMLVDGIISHPSSDKNTLFLIKFEFKKENSNGEDQVDTSPQDWISQMKKVEQLKELKDFRLIFIFFTNGNIPIKTKEMMEQNIQILIVDQRSFKEFFSPNLYPYVKYFHDEKKPESNEQK